MASAGIVRLTAVYTMKKLIITLFCFVCLVQMPDAKESIDSIMPQRGLCISVPSRDGLTAFVNFIDNEMAPANFNLLILRIGYNYEYKSHPELRDKNGLTDADIRKIKAVCQRHNIRIVPLVNLLGHQSWHFTTDNLLKAYPQFDETPHVKLDEARAGQTYEWPNPEGLYCKSYCPNHPDVHKVVFEVVDEIMDVFGADTFHAGMDEVFYIAHDKCPRCKGSDKAELFAAEVTRIHNHLAQSNRKMMIWGDRLIDGETTGMGEWEASMNQTHRAIDLIPGDVVICDWHYDRAEPSASYFAAKGLDVLSCPWNRAHVGQRQSEDMVRLRNQTNRVMKDRFKGVVQTVWSGCDNFIKAYSDPESYKNEKSEAACFKAVADGFRKLSE